MPGPCFETLAWAIERPAAPRHEVRVTFLRDRKVRDVLWQALATVGLVVVVVFFVRNASDNMVKAGIASGFQFLWRNSGIEVPFNITGYKPSDTILALLWTGIVNTLLVSRRRRRRGDRRRLHRRPDAAVAQLAAVDAGRASTSSSSATSRCCSSCCSGTSACSRPCRRPSESYDFLGVAFLNRRGLSIPLPNDVTRLPARPLLAIAVADRRADRARPLGARPARRGPAGTSRPGWWASCCAALLPIAGLRRRGRRPRAGTCRRCAASTIAAASCWCRSSWRCSWRCRPTPRASSPKSCAAASSRCARARSMPRGRSA